jgi:hypothetical protein
MSIRGMLHFHRDISYNVGIIPALNPQDSLTKRKPASLAEARCNKKAPEDPISRALNKLHGFY